MADPLRLFILAGEPSGDRIAADLVRRLRRHGPLELNGVGGFELIGEGLNSLYPMSDLSVMGISDVLKRLPLLLWRVEQTARAALKYNPDIVVLVDAQEFSALLARRLRAKRPDLKIVLYVSPSVWARHPERAKKIKPLFDEVLAVLPFEPAAMIRLGGPPTTYVGHPALGEMQSRMVLGDGRLVALLPGSRPGELRRHLPLFKAAAQALAKRGDVDAFFLPTLPALAADITAETSQWGVDIKVVSERAERVALYDKTALALTCAGTATLELAMAAVPMLVAYVMDGFQAKKFNDFGRPRVSLPNIILDADLLPELIMAQPDETAVIAEAGRLLDDTSARVDQLAAFEKLRQLMDMGALGYPRQDPAERVLARVKG